MSSCHNSFILNPGSHLSEKHLLFLLIHIFDSFQITRGESKLLSEVLKLPKKFFSHYFSCFIAYSFLWEPYVLTKTEYKMSPKMVSILLLHLMPKKITYYYVKCIQPPLSWAFAVDADTDLSLLLTQH